MADWKPLQDVYGAELHCLDARGPGFVIDPSCVECGKHDDVRFCCLDCHGGDMLCSTWTLNVHHRMPLHHIEVRSSAYAQLSELTSLSEMVRQPFLSYLAVHARRNCGFRPPATCGMQQPNIWFVDLHGDPHKWPSPSACLVLRL
jgi:hypothetical protein